MQAVDDTNVNSAWNDFTQIQDSVEQDTIVAEAFLEIAKHMSRQAAIRGISGFRIEKLPPNHVDNSLNKCRALRIRTMLKENGILVGKLYRRQRSGHPACYSFTIHIPSSDCRIKEPAQRIASEMLAAGTKELQLGRDEATLSPKWPEPEWQTRHFPLLDALYHTQNLNETVAQFTFLRKPLREETQRELLKQATQQWRFWTGVTWKVDSDARLQFHRWTERLSHNTLQGMKDDDWHNLNSVLLLREKPADLCTC